MTLSLTNNSTQNTQIYQVATTDPTTSYTAIQASHVGAGTANNALVINPSGGNVGVGTTTPAANLAVFGSATASTANTTILLDNSLSGGVIAAGGVVGSLQFNNNGISAASIQAVHDVGSVNNNGALTFNTRTDYVTNTEKMRITRDGNVGIGTTAPQAALHVQGGTLFTNPTVYNTAVAGWFIIGLWDCSVAPSAGAHLKLRIMGMNGYDNSVVNNQMGGETTIYLNNLNDANTTTNANVDGVWKHEGGIIPITQVKAVQNGSSRFQYYLYAYVQTYTQHSITADTTQGTIWTSQFTSTTDPGANSLTVRALTFSTVVMGTNVGIGTTTPAQLLDITNAASLIPAIRVQNQYSAGYVSMGSNPGVNSFIGLQATNTTTSSLTTPALAVSNSGNVGVGTTTPIYKLQIEQGFGSDSNGLFISNTNYGSMQGVNISMVNAGTSYFNSYAAIQGYRSGVAAGTTPLCLQPTSGNVGIGYTAPAATLHVLNPTPQAGNTTMVTAQIIGRPATGGIQNGTSCGFAIGASGGLPDAASRMDVMVAGASYAGNNWGYTPDVPVATFLGSGAVGVGTVSPVSNYRMTVIANGSGTMICYKGSEQIFAVWTPGPVSNSATSSTDSVLYVAKDTATHRSINAAGTFNASGADYAEYMTKDSDFSAQKGDLLGVLPSGKLTNQFDDAIHFLLKSTNPCMVGGDVWGTEAIVGEKPKEPENATEEEKEAYVIALAAWKARLEAERQKVDRMAFAGQVPVNIQGTTPGDYIIPLRNADGTIGVAAVSKADMSFSQYQSAVGRVISILEDGRANVIVKAV